MARLRQRARALAAAAVAMCAVLAMSGGSAHAAAPPPSTLPFNHFGTKCVSTSAHNLSTKPKMSQTGIALVNGKLLISCWGDTTIAAVDPHNPNVNPTIYTIAAGVYQAFGALAYDPTDNLLWACASTNSFGSGPPENEMSEVGIIDIGTQTFSPQFNSPGCDNGLAWDPGTTPARQDTLWTSADLATTIYNYPTSAPYRQLASEPVGGLVGPGGKNSGIAIGGGNFYLADPQTTTKRVFQTSDFSSSTQVLSGTNRYEDMECDDQTYAPQTVIWVMWFNQNTLKPLPIAGTCNQAPPPPPTLQLTQASDGPVTAGDQDDFTDTATNGDAVNPQTNVNISQSLPANATFVSVNPSIGGTCSTTATAVSCSFALLAASQTAQMDVTFGTLIPGQLTGPATAQSDTQGPVTPLSPASVTVTPATGVTYVTVADGGITPASPAPTLGNTTQFVIEGSSPHQIADDTDTAGFDSGQLAPPAAYDFSFTASGGYKVIDPTTGHTATVEVATENPLNVNLSDGAFTVAWALAPLPGGCVEDVQVMAPGGAWANFKKGTTDLSDPYTPTKTGTYKFRARLHCGGHETAFGTGNSTKVS